MCDDEWGLEDAAVVCHQLGFKGVERASRESEFGVVSSSFIMDNVDCAGNESSLQECQHKTGDDCDGHEAAGVVCTDQHIELYGCDHHEGLCLLGGDTR